MPMFKVHCGCGNFRYVHAIYVMLPICNPSVCPFMIHTVCVHMYIEKGCAIHTILSTNRSLGERILKWWNLWASEQIGGLAGDISNVQTNGICFGDWKHYQSFWTLKWVTLPSPLKCIEGLKRMPSIVISAATENVWVLHQKKFSWRRQALFLSWKEPRSLAIPHWHTM